jgi:hypothetical protein
VIGRRPAIVQGFAVAATAVTLLAGAGCLVDESNDGFPGVAVVGGNESRGGGAGADSQGGFAGAGGEGSAKHCSALPFGCVCSPTEPTQVGACTMASVIKKAGQQGVCCDNDVNCICLAYECVRAGGGCSCQLAQASLAGTRVDDCAAVTTNPTIKCCRSYGQCVCAAADCLLTETIVAGCSVQDLLSCAAGERTVGTCEVVP